MIRVARTWFNYLAEYHHERALDHARRRDRALRKLEQLERAHYRRENQRLIAEILDRRAKASPAPAEIRAPAELIPLRPLVRGDDVQ